jgi:hypothetical protein
MSMRKVSKKGKVFAFEIPAAPFAFSFAILRQ